MTVEPDKFQRRSRIRRTVLMGLFTGTAVGAGYLLSGVPNIELMTFIVVLAGGALGKSAGAACGVLAAFIYSVGNPYGMALPPLLAAQAVGLGLAGWLGGASMVTIMSSLGQGRRWRAAWQSWLVGASATLGYDVLTNLAAGLAFALDWRVVVAGAIPFALLHQLGNAPLFLFFYPWLLPRCVRSGRTPLRGTGTAPLFIFMFVTATLWITTADALAQTKGDDVSGGSSDADTVSVTDRYSGAGGDSLAVTLPDTLAAMADTTATTVVQRGPTGRPLWHPFMADLFDLLSRYSFYVPVRDGGFGANVVYLQEPNTSPYPLFVRDGIPLTTGHRWADDPNTVAITGLSIGRNGYGLDYFGGTDGTVRFVRQDPRPDQTFLEARFFAGPHNTKLRSIAFMTPKAPWRLLFDFEETWDWDGYDFSTPTDSRFMNQEQRGGSKLRNARIGMQRNFAEATLTLEVSTLRKFKNSLPSMNEDHQEIWGDQASLTWEDKQTFLGPFRGSLFWIGRDVEWEWERKLEASREGVLLQWGDESPERGLLRIMFNDWRVNDTGAGAWADADSGAVQAQGQDGGGRLAIPWRLAPIAGQLAVSGWWDDRAGSILGGNFTMGQARENPWWQLSLEHGGRAPRRDEQVTAERTFTVSDTYVLLPNPDLQRESTWRGSMRLAGRLLGTDLALEGSVRYLEDGIVWMPLDPETDPYTGKRVNALEMVSQTVTGHISYLGRLWGWLQLSLRAAWREQDIRSGLPPALPPELSGVVEMLWEKRFFKEDGILELGYWYGYRGEMNDPWVPAGLYALPSVARHDFMLGFRLVGADLNMEVRNLTNKRQQISAGAMSPGQEIRWRLQWRFTR